MKMSQTTQFDLLPAGIVSNNGSRLQTTEEGFESVNFWIFIDAQVISNSALRVWPITQPRIISE
jgi:hypothetical protein